jgi:hypothetical protein
MTPIQAAALFLRLFSVYLCLNIILVLTELPPNIYGIISLRSDYLMHQRVLMLGLELFRVFVYASLAVTFLVFNRPLAKLFAKGLESLKNDDAP